jgi:hypothetical protein
MELEKQAYTIKEFCTAFSISRTMLHYLWGAGKGPPRANFGCRVLIPAQSARDWLHAHRSALK